MEETYDTSQLDQSALQGLLSGGGSNSLIPETLVTTLTVGFIVLNVLGILFLVFYIISLIRKWKVESAVLSMQKDLAEIKTALAQSSPAASTATPASTTPPAVAPVSPTQSSNVIAQANSSSDRPTDS